MRRGDSTGAEVVRRLCATEGQFHVSVGIDAAWNDQLAAGINVEVGFDVELSPDDGHNIVFDQNIRLVVVNRRDNAPIFDYGFQLYVPSDG